MAAQKINYAEDIVSLSEFRTELTDRLEQTRKTHRPIIITQHGKSAGIFVDVNDYQKLQSKIEFLEEYKLSTQDVIKGRMVSSERARSHIQSRIDEL
jgi:prevent-host-death family protein